MSKEQATPIWPEVLNTGIEPEKYKTDPRRKWMLCADGLMGWALASHAAAPAKFGWGMIVIADVLGCGPTGPDFEKWSKENPVPEEITRKYAPHLIDAPCGTITTADRRALNKPTTQERKIPGTPARYHTIYSKKTHALLKDKFNWTGFEESTRKPYYHYHGRL